MKDAIVVFRAFLSVCMIGVIVAQVVLIYRMHETRSRRALRHSERECIRTNEDGSMWTDADGRFGYGPCVGKGAKR